MILTYDILKLGGHFKVFMLGLEVISQVFPLVLRGPKVCDGGAKSANRNTPIVIKLKGHLSTLERSRNTK